MTDDMRCHVLRLPRFTRRTVPLLMVGCVLTFAVSIQGQTQTQPYRDPSNRFTFQYPRKDWLVFPGAGTTLATVGEKRGKVSIQIEYLQLSDPVNIQEVFDIVVGIETDFIRKQQPTAEGIKAQPMRPDMKEALILEYTLPGGSGPDRVRQYSINKDRHLFRISCVAPASAFAKFEPVFDRLARSFVITGGQPTSEPIAGLTEWD
jgi:hypothetical protein